MQAFTNIWKHPRTTAAGVLIAVSTVAGVLGQSGVTLGHVGTANTVTLAGALAAALLGLLARDPAEAAKNNANDTNAQQPAAGPQAKSNTGNAAVQQSAKSVSGAILRVGVVAALLLPLPLLEGCNAHSVAQQIVNWTPALESAVASVDSMAAVLAPQDEPAFATITAGFDAASNVLAAQAQAYLAHPGAGTLAQLQTQVVVFQQQVNAALLTAAKVTDVASRQKALMAVQAVATAVSAILALVQSVSSGVAVGEMAAASAIKLAQVEPLIDHDAEARMVAAHSGEPVDVARVQVERVRVELMEAGF